MTASHERALSAQKQQQRLVTANEHIESQLFCNMNMILKLFRKKVVTQQTENDNKESKKSKTSKRKSLKKHPETTSTNSKQPESTASIAARKFIEATNNHSETESKALFTPNCIVYFPEAEILGHALIEELIGISKSFPDFQLSFEKIEYIGPNVAKLCNLRASGTHTGEPYGFGPYPPIAATGKKVLNDPEEATITVDEHSNLVTKIEFVAKGRLSGPPGLYEQIGGILF